MRGDNHTHGDQMRRAHFSMTGAVPSPAAATFSMLLALLTVLIPIAWTPPSAHATIGADVYTELLGAARPATAGEQFDGQLEFGSAGGGMLSSFVVGGPGWINGTVDVPGGQIMVPAGGTVLIGFSATCQDPDQLLSLSFFLDGELVEKDLDLSQANYQRVTQENATVKCSDVIPITKAVYDTPPTRPEPAPADPEEWQHGKLAGGHGDGEHSPDPTKDRQITVEGSWKYTRDMFNATGVGPIVKGAFGTTVRVYDDDLIGKKLLAETTTDENGNYSVTFWWNECVTCESNPDIFVQFRSENADMKLTDDTWPHNIYKFKSSTKENFAGTHADFGSLTPSDDSLHGVPHILNNVSLANEFMSDHGYPTDDMKIRFPDKTKNAQVSFYRPSSKALHILSSDAWSEHPHGHEYTHHWMQTWSPDLPSPDYCNGVCDTGNCGHCMFCDENPNDAWSEGVPGWIGYTLTRDIDDALGNPGLIAIGTSRDLERLGTCTSGGTATPNQAEGFTGALLVDIEDDALDDNTPSDGNFDKLSMGAQEILDTIALDDPQTTVAFLNDFEARNPEVCKELWETAKDIGFDIDTTAPGNPADIVSTSHTINVSSIDPTISFEYTRPTDDCSEVEGYSIVLSDVPELPDTTIDHRAHNKPVPEVLTTDFLAPGSWYLSMRTVDWAGNWSSTFSSSGPYVIREPLPADIAWYENTGYDYPLVPRSTPDAVGGAAQVSANLDGDVENTYWNVGYENVGDEDVANEFHSRLHLDGVPLGAVEGGFDDDYIPGGLFNLQINKGPIEVRGGRHFLSIFYDYDNELPEAGETDNFWGKQFIWTPTAIARDVNVVRSAPPDPRGGMEHRPNVNFLYDNCDGVRASTPGGYDAVVVYPQDDEVDYDAKLFEVSLGALDGFAASSAHSHRPPGKLDAVIANFHLPPHADAWDVGVYNYTESDSDYRVRHVPSVAMSFYTGVQIDMAADERMILREFYIDGSEVGWNSIELESDPADGKLHIGWYDSTRDQFALLDGDAHETTDSVTGDAVVSLNCTQAGWNLVIVWRDPIDIPAAKKADPIGFTLTSRRTYGDLVAYEDAPGWHSPLVPLGDTSGTPGSVPLPATLPGGQNSTYLNVAITNQGDGRSFSGDAWIYGDGNVVSGYGLPELLAGDDYFLNTPIPITIPGGRHTMTMSLTAPGYEVLDDNNLYSEQYVWEPLPLVINLSVGWERFDAPSPYAGWIDAGPVEGTTSLNCNGYRLPSSGRFKGVAALPEMGGDVDLRLHPRSTGAKDGFTTALAISAWGESESDFLLVNEHLTGTTIQDVGVVGCHSAPDYRLDAVDATFIGANPDGPYGPFPFPAGRTLKLHEVALTPGGWTIGLENMLGNVDWGVSLHPADAPYISKSMVVENGAAWMRGAGESEAMLVDVAEPGLYCVAVWRRAAVDVSKAEPAGTYQLRFRSLATDAPPELEVSATGLRSIHPNPFNPRTTIQFDLTAAGKMQLSLYNARGARVRTLIDEHRPAGRHEIVWNGRDDAGRDVASGIFFVRLRAGGDESVRKITLVR